MNPLLAIGADTALSPITPDHVAEAIPALLEELETARSALVARDAPTWRDVFALDAALTRLNSAEAIVSIVTMTTEAPALEAAHDAVIDPMEEARSRLWSDPAVFEALGRVEAEGLSVEQRRHVAYARVLLEHRGAGLAAADRQRLVAIDAALAKTTLAFARAARADGDAWTLDLTADQLGGLPAHLVAAARERALRDGVDGWRLGLDQPTYHAVLRSADDPGVREAFFRGWAQRGRTSNHDRIARILLLRREKAALLGFEGFADLVTATRMAGDGDTVRGFLDTLSGRARPFMEREHAELEAFGGRALDPWDVHYVRRALREERFGLDADALRPWFPCDHVLGAVFEVAKRLFDVEVVERDPAGWAPGIRTFDLLDADGARRGRFHLDLHPRTGKRSGAWMSGLWSGRHGGPALALICGNLTAPRDGEPACLTHSEATTLFHEFGHLLHYLLSDAPSTLLFGTAVPRDFVELPSQILEEWLWTRDGLALATAHVDTGEPLPADIVDRLLGSRAFGAGTAMMRQLGLATVDLALHEDWEPHDGHAVEFARDVQDDFSPVTLPDDYAMVCSFGHLFASPVGYAAGYYVYKWAEVLSVDAFGAFTDAGVFDAATGRRFRDAVLSRGNTRDALDQFVAFRGREPSLEPLLARLGGV